MKAATARFMLIAIALGALSSCATIAAVDRRPEVDAALQHYSDLVLHMDNVGIAALFEERGELKLTDHAPVYGPAAVRGLLDTFKETKVLKYQIHANTTSVRGDTAAQSGTYQEKTVSPNQQAVDASGHFDVIWVRGSDGRWLIHQLSTTPDRGKKPAGAKR
jgi:ketosteroid isomerase-like protein